MPTEPPVLKRANCRCTDCGRERRCANGSYPRPPTQHDVWCECKSYPDEVAIVTESTFPWDDSTVSPTPSCGTPNCVPPQLQMPVLKRANCQCTDCGREKRCTDGSYPRPPTTNDVWCNCHSQYNSEEVVDLLHRLNVSTEQVNNLLINDVIDYVVDKYVPEVHDLHRFISNKCNCCLRIRDVEVQCNCTTCGNEMRNPDGTYPSYLDESQVCNCPHEYGNILPILQFKQVCYIFESELNSESDDSEIDFDSHPEIVKILVPMVCPTLERRHAQIFKWCNHCNKNQREDDGTYPYDPRGREWCSCTEVLVKYTVNNIYLKNGYIRIEIPQDWTK